MAEMTPRREALDGVAPIAVRSKLTIEAAPVMARHSFRGSLAAAAMAGASFGLALPTVLNTASSDGTRSAFMLGPDEWLLLGGAMDGFAPSEACSLVDVSHRNTGLLVSGLLAVDVLNAHVMLDLSASTFPVGMATRTLFTKAEIALWRTGAQSFHIEVWRSFAPYVQGLLAEAAREHAR